MASITLPALRRSSRLASQGGWKTAQEIASKLENGVKKLAALESADIQKMNLYGRWETLGREKHCWLVHMLSADGYDLLDNVFQMYKLYCESLYWESPQLLQPAAEKMKELLMSAQPAVVLPEKLAGATWRPSVYLSPPETVVAEEAEEEAEEEPEDQGDYSCQDCGRAQWRVASLPDEPLCFLCRADINMKKALEEPEPEEECRGCGCGLSSYEYTYCYGCVEGMDENWKGEKMEKKERCHNCCCHFSTAPSGRIVCGCDDY
jgi:hypothetical protein